MWYSMLTGIAGYPGQPGQVEGQPGQWGGGNLARLGLNLGWSCEGLGTTINRPSATQGRVKGRGFFLAYLEKKIWKKDLEDGFGKRFGRKIGKEDLDKDLIWLASCFLLGKCIYTP